MVFVYLSYNPCEWVYYEEDVMQEEIELLKQLVLRAIRFAPQKVEGWNWLPGTAITGLEEWKLTAEMVRSTMVQTTKLFTGISPIRGGSGDYYAAYREWGLFQ